MTTFAISTIFRGVDQMSGVFAAMEQNGSAAFKRIEDSATARFDHINSVIKKTGAGFGYVGAGMVAVGGAMTAGLVDATREANQFYKGVAEVSTLIKGMSLKEVEGKFGPLLLDLSRAYGQSAGQVTKAAYQAISAGVDATVGDLGDFLKVAAGAATAGVTTIEVAVDGLTSVVNAYGKSNINAKQAADLMFQSVVGGKTTFEELSAALFHVVPIAAANKVSFNDVTAAIASMTAQGTPTKVATTQMRQMIVELSKSNTAAAKTFRQLSGKAFPDFMAAGGSLADALAVMESGAQKTGKRMGDMFSSVEASQAALQLTGVGARKFASDLEAAKNSAGSADAAFAKMSESSAFKFEQMEAAINRIKIKIGGRLLPIIDKYMPDMLAFADSIVGLIDDGTVRNIALAAGALTAVGTAFLFVSAGLTATSAALALVNAGLMGPILVIGGTALLFVAAVAAMGISLYYFWDDWVQVWGQITGAASNAVKFLSDLFGLLVAGIMALPNVLMGSLYAVGAMIMRAITLPLKGVLTLAAMIPGAVGEKAAAALSTIEGAQAGLDTGMTGKFAAAGAVYEQEAAPFKASREAAYQSGAGYDRVMGQRTRAADQWALGMAYQGGTERAESSAGFFQPAQHYNSNMAVADTIREREITREKQKLEIEIRGDGAKNAVVGGGSTLDQFNLKKTLAPVSGERS